MKFGRQLEVCLIPAWRSQYLDYKKMKKLLEEAISGRLGAESVQRRLSINNVSRSPPMSPQAVLRRPSQVRSVSSVSFPIPASDTVSQVSSPQRSSAFEIWQGALQREVMRVAQFWHSSMDGLEAELTELAVLCNEIFNRDACCASSGPDELLELRALQALSRHSDSARKLRTFAELNHVALFKILKKYDKRCCCGDGLSELFPQLVNESGLGDMSRLDKLDTEIRRLSLLSASCQGLGDGVSLGVLHMVAGVQSRSVLENSGATSLDYQRALSFFLGTSIGLFVAIAILIWIPPEASEEKPFSVAYFLAPFAVFRVGLSILLSLWCTGAVAQVCASKGINHLYLFNVDPRCKIGPGFFFTRAAALTSVWILVFGTYVVDYKWMLLPQWGADRGYNLRSSSHYCAYPAILVILIFVGLALPSRVAPGRYKRGLLKSVARTALAPFFTVSFADNVVGDVLTSLVKPLQDLPPTICYFASSHPQTARNVDRFSEHGDVCPHWVHYSLQPIIAALPLAFRAFQCLRRFRDTREAKHLFNFGKYSCALLVVIVSAWLVHRANNLVQITFSMLATIYAATWDLCLDWGLGRQELFGSPARTPVQETSAGEDARGNTSAVTVQRSRFKPTDRMFKPCTYRTCAIFDILARLSWVQTLLPINIITNDIVQREVILVFLTALEILRRSVWAALRIEYEQHTNAGGFRAILWVPNALETEKYQEFSPLGNPIPDVMLQSSQNLLATKDKSTTPDSEEAGELTEQASSGGKAGAVPLLSAV